MDRTKILSRTHRLYNHLSDRRIDQRRCYDFECACKGISSSTYVAPEWTRDALTLQQTPQLDDVDNYATARFLKLFNELRVFVSETRALTQLPQCLYILLDEVSERVLNNFDETIRRVHRQAPNMIEAIRLIVSQYAEDVHKLLKFVKSVHERRLDSAGIMAETKRELDEPVIGNSLFRDILARSYAHGDEWLERQSRDAIVTLGQMRATTTFDVFMRSLPYVLLSMKNFVIDDFIRETADVDWAALAGSRGAQLRTLNHVYARAIQRAPQSSDALARMVYLSMSSTSAAAAAAPADRDALVDEVRLTELEPVLNCAEVGVACTPLVKDQYRRLFRLRHTLRRTLFQLTTKQTACRRHAAKAAHGDDATARAVARDTLILTRSFRHFVQRYESYVFGYSTAAALTRLVAEYDAKADTENATRAARLLAEALGGVVASCLVESESGAFMSPMWTLLATILAFALTPDASLAETCASACACLRRAKRAFAGCRRHEIPQIAVWLFGPTLETAAAVKQTSGKTDGAANDLVKLCNELNRLAM